MTFHLSKAVVGEMWHGRRAILLNEPAKRYGAPPREDFGFMCFFLPLALIADIALFPLYIVGGLIWRLATRSLRREVENTKLRRRIEDLERETGISV